MQVQFDGEPHASGEVTPATKLPYDARSFADGLGFTFDGGEQDIPERQGHLLPYNPTVMRVFGEHTRHPGNVLLGGVGDLNNLGVHVATRGRAAAENLVDLYNQAIRNAVSTWHRNHKSEVSAITFVPSGEEVLILASVQPGISAVDLFDTITLQTDAYMQNQKIIDVGGTSACFGFLELDGYDDRLVGLDTAANGDDDEETARQYFDILADMRTAMGNQLDFSKFADRLDPASEHLKPQALALRRLAWAGMLGYKRSVHEIISSMSKHSDTPEVVELFARLAECVPALPDEASHIGILDQAAKIMARAQAGSAER